MRGAAIPVDPDISQLLRQLFNQYSAGDVAAQQTSLDAIGPARCKLPSTLVCGLCLGGAEFGARLAGHGRPMLNEPERYGALVEALNTMLEPPGDAVDDHEELMAEQLIKLLDLTASARSLFDVAKADILITAGPLEEVPEAALAGIRHGQWELALRGFVRLQQSLREKAPNNVFGLAAMCLHRLERYDEANQWVDLGLGAQRDVIAIGKVHSEGELMQRWFGRRSPVVSILCMTYNHVRYIESAIRGFLSQNCKYAFEILIHDDASTDGTREIIEKWQQRYPNIIRAVLQTENQFSKGVRPFEILLKMARGEFVATCEGDDFWIDPAKLQLQVGFLKSNPEYACSAHNYYLFVEVSLTVSPFTSIRQDHALTPRQLMGLERLIWLPTLVFRKTFSVMPPERDLAAFGDQFLLSYLGTFGPCAFLESVLGAVRRENEFSFWTPLPAAQKERMRLKTWAALVRMHTRLGNREAVADLMAKIEQSRLDASEKAQILDVLIPELAAA